MGNGSNQEKSKAAKDKTEGSDQGYLTSWVFKTGYDRNDALLKEIQKNFSDKASILELFSQYMAELRTNPDNNALQLQKMAKLFEMGVTPDSMGGHYYGVPLVPNG